MEEVVITGMGVVSCLGNEVDELWSNLVSGKSGISNIERFDTEKYAVKFAGEVKEFDASPYFSERDAKRTSRNIMYQVHTVEKAIEMANLDRDAVDKTRAGVILGSGMGGMEIFQDSSVANINKGPRRVSPFFVPMAITNMAAGEVGIRLGWMGPNWATASACATSNHAIMTAADQIRLGRADVMVAGGSEEAVCEIGVAGFASMKALSTRNDDPTAASRPFDVDRDGFVIGEGAGAIVLESESHAKARGATILARLSGYAATCDAYHMSAPREDGAGVAMCLENALKSGGLSTSDIHYVNTHGTSTPLGDVAECGAVMKAFGSNPAGLKINSTKSMVGHGLGAASAIESVVTIKSVMEQKLHGTLNLANQDPKIELDCCADGAVDHKIDYAISNSFGFGGHNSSVIFGKA
jgi:3-oxoacyl-[acyl-carrier-protein] synthase II